MSGRMSESICLLVPNRLVAPPTRSHLAEIFDAIGVRAGTYHLDGAHLDVAFVIDHRSGGWVVSYSERSPATWLGPRSACERWPCSWTEPPAYVLTQKSRDVLANPARNATLGRYPSDWRRFLCRGASRYRFIARLAALHLP